MDFPYLISSLKYQLDDFKASEAGNKRGTCPIRGLCVLLLPILFVVSPPHRPTQHLSAGSSLQGHHPNQSYQVHQDLDTVLHTAVQAGDQTLSPLCPPDVAQLLLLSSDRVVQENRRSPVAYSKSPAGSVPKHYCFYPEEVQLSGRFASLHLFS